MENLIFHPVYIEKKKSAQLVSAQSQEIKEILRKRREEELAVKRALIKARRNKVISASPANDEKECNSSEAADKDDQDQISKELNLNIATNNSTDLKQETSPLISTLNHLKEADELIESQKLDLNDEKIDLNDEKIDDDWNAKLVKENVMQNNYKLNLKDDKMRKKKSRKWLKYKKHIFDNASSVYLESKNLKDFIRKKKEEELAEKRAKVNARRQTLTLEKNKRHYGIWMSRNLVKQKDQNQDLQASQDRKFSEDEEDQLNDIQEDFSDVQSSPDQASDLNIYNSEDEEKDYSDDNDDDYSSSDTNDDDNETTTYPKIELYCQCKKVVCNYTTDTPLKSNENNNFNDMKKEIFNAYINLKACESIIITPNISMKTHEQKDSINRQRQSRRSSVAELRRRRSEAAQSLRRETLSVEETTREARDREVKEKRTKNAVIRGEKSERRASVPDSPKPSRWTLERASLEREFEIRLQQEKVLMHKLMTSKYNSVDDN